MSIEEAIKELINRNKGLVAKYGVSSFSKKGDDIINAILEYYHRTKSLSELEEIHDLLNEIIFGKKIVWHKEVLKMLSYPEYMNLKNEYKLKIFELERVNSFYNLDLELKSYSVMNSLAKQKPGYLKGKYGEYLAKEYVMPMSDYISKVNRTFFNNFIINIAYATD